MDGPRVKRRWIVVKARPVVAAAAVLSVSLLGAQAFASSDGAGENRVDARAASPSLPVDTAATAGARARGLVLTGLLPGFAGSPCEHQYVVELPGAVQVCTHGPDPAPDGVDVTQPRSASELAAATSSTSTSSTTSGAVPCYGDGVTGNRVQVIYAHASDVADRYADLATLIPQWIASADSVYADSAAETGGVRHVRWVMDSSCNLSVARVQLSPTGDDSFANTTSELQSLGYTRKDRKYLVLVDANIYCGIAGIQNDDSASSRNANNIGPSFARVDSGCWGLMNPVEAHEVMHNLGGVQLSAPHSSGGWHCTDEYDRMCYAENSTMTLTYPCDASHERLFDCGHDDYFSTAPAAGSYLDTHWNAASSSFLETVEPSSAGSTSPSPSPSPSASSTTSTVSYSGSFGRKATTASYTLATGAGTLSISGSFRKGYTMTLTVTDASGNVLGSTSGPSPVQLTAPVSAGQNVIQVSGSGNYSYTLAVTYPNP